MAIDLPLLLLPGSFYVLQLDLVFPHRLYDESNHTLSLIRLHR